MPAVRCRHVKIRVAVESQTLRTSEPTVKDGNIAALRDAINAVIARSSRPRNVEVAARMKRQMIRREGRLQRSKHKNLAARANFENGAAAVANVEIFGVVERDPGGDAHTFNPLFGATLRRHAMNGAVMAARDEEAARTIHSQARWIDQRGDERLHAVVGRNLVK